MRRGLALAAAACFVIALLELLTTGIRHDVLLWIVGGLLALALRCLTEGARVGD